jgi:ribosome-binding protein aMBF1 (putative translation factor)
MNLQTIKSIDGKVEYVLLPITAYNALSQELIEQLKNFHDHEDYELFDPADYVDNPVALARIEAGITQKELAKRMHVTQAYVSKIEGQSKPSLKTIKKVELAIGEDSQN